MQNICIHFTTFSVSIFWTKMPIKRRSTETSIYYMTILVKILQSIFQFFVRGFSSDFHMQLSKIITANIAVKWGQGSNLPVIRPDFFVTPTDYLFADFYNTQRTLCQCSIKSCYIIVIQVDIYSLCRSRRVRCTDHRTGRVKYFLDKHISPYKGCCRI